MSGPVPRRASFAGAALSATLSLSLCGSIQASAQAPNQPAALSAADNAAPLNGLLGPWIRNSELSENPIQETAAAARKREFVSLILNGLARDLADRVHSLMVEIEDQSVVVLDSLGETRVLPLDGSWRILDPQSQGRVLGAGDALSIETVAVDWLGTDTFRHRQDQLVRTIHLRSRSLANVWVSFRTVYERPPSGSASDHPFIDTVGGFANPATILIVPPERGYGPMLRGRVAVQTLVVDPTVAAVDFRLDGRVTRRVKRPPYRTHIELDEPPREQTLEVRAYDVEGQLLGTDSLIVNRIDGPSAIQIASIRTSPSDSASDLLVEAIIPPPWSAQLDRVDFFRSGDLVATLDHFDKTTQDPAPESIHVEALIADPQPDDFVHVKARLADGRELEDAELLREGNYRAEVDVHLVQIQVLVTDREGNPVRGLSPGDFEIREDGRRVSPDHLHTSRDVRLVLGFAIDSSESMRPAWSHLRHVAERFLSDSVAPEDSAFLVDFDDTVRLLQPPTRDRLRLTAGLRRLVPGGGTALSDGLLFSLLQFRKAPGRRALVVVTDGIDLDSRSEWQLPPEFAERLGLPIYFIELDRSAKPVIGNDSLVAGKPDATLLHEQARRRLRRISRQTGGRHFHIDLVAHGVGWTARIDQAFDQIEEDLRHQHVLTYYTDLPLGARVEPEVRVARRGLRLRSAVPLEAIE